MTKNTKTTCPRCGMSVMREYFSSSGLSATTFFCMTEIFEDGETVFSEYCGKAHPEDGRSEAPDND